MAAPSPESDIRHWAEFGKDYHAQAIRKQAIRNYQPQTSHPQLTICKQDSALLWQKAVSCDSVENELRYGKC